MQKSPALTRGHTGFEGDLFYGTQYGGDNQEELTNIVSGPGGRVYVSGHTTSGSLFPLNNPIPGVSWYVEELATEAEDLFYGQVRLVLLPVALSDTEGLSPLGIQVYPNPATQLLTIDPGPDHPATYRITVIDALGQVVSQTAGNGKTLTIDIDAYPPGWYLVQLEDLRGSILGHAAFTKQP